MSDETNTQVVDALVSMMGPEEEAAYRISETLDLSKVRLATADNKRWVVVKQEGGRWWVWLEAPGGELSPDNVAFAQLWGAYGTLASDPVLGQPAEIVFWVQAYSGERSEREARERGLSWLKQSAAATVQLLNGRKGYR